MGTTTVGGIRFYNQGSETDIKTFKDVNFLDYDGTILYSFSKSEWSNQTDLPANPVHSGLIAEGWDWTKEEIDDQLSEVGGCVIVGQRYITDDEKTRLYVTFTGGVHPYLGLSVNGEVEVDWGDGTEKTTIIGTGSASYTQHDYPEGSYIIKIKRISGTFSAAGGNSSVSLLLSKNKSTGSNGYVNRYILASLKKVELGTGFVFTNYAFTCFYSLKSITVSKNTSYSSMNNAFTGCRALRYACIRWWQGYTFNSTSVSYITPHFTTNISANLLNGSEQIVAVSVKKGAPGINNNAFANCYSLQKIYIPNTVTTIGTGVFNNCYGMKEYHFKSTTPPTLGDSTTVFGNIQSDCVIYVPSSSVNTYKTATNWVSWSSYIQGE